MNGPESLVLDLLEWTVKAPRTYRETMDVWRTSCPRLPVWEDAVDRGLIQCVRANGTTMVTVTDEGLALLATRSPAEA
ncbi:hypothetical protein DLJ53_15445 [Acuticoccus sediminis]|uniref:Uncharacterized protein n=1 Tax=Acuticoccus sediminis TaxID=2184697 RepID=A0A8B2NQQ1_9HYPH|nr:hypothetical protein [Acuticoccus sediminis]RAI00650.1 hypothetical protein DLJ53_15445 [Acuticoccus sediminis]